MKRVGLIFSIIIFIVLSPLSFVQAQEDYSHLFISVGDAIMKVKENDWESAEKLVAQLSKDWEHVEYSKSEEAEKVEQSISKLSKLVKAREAEPMLEGLSDVSHRLVAFEKEQNPVDQENQREEFLTTLAPKLNQLEQAINEADEKGTYENYQSFLSAWNQNERIVREQSIAYYGKIETQMGFLRIALTQEDKDFSKIQSIYHELEGAVQEFGTGKQLKTTDQDYSIDTLVGLLEKANQAIEKEKPDQAVAHLEEFLTVWPSAEGEVSAKNGSLYTDLENNIPVLAGRLSSKNAAIEDIQSEIINYQNALVLLQNKTSYTVWDAALIILREGLEALLIVTALLAFLRKANASSQQKWIWVGVIVGVLMSVASAILINKVFSAATAGVNREVFEGVTGILAVMMMTGVGIWLHQKSSMKAWNQFIERRMGTALSTGSIFSLAFVSFLSIFREGAETIIFYIGMAPSISFGKMLVGILIAVGILSVFAFLFIRYSTKIAVRPFFKIATILIYLIAFKILGISIHALQLTDLIQTTQMPLPILDWAGFYPTLETMLPQLFLLLIFFVTALRIEKGDKKEQANVV